MPQIPDLLLKPLFSIDSSFSKLYGVRSIAGKCTFYSKTPDFSVRSIAK